MTPEHLAEAAEAASNEASRVLASGRGHPTGVAWGGGSGAVLGLFGRQRSGTKWKEDERTLDLR